MNSMSLQALIVDQHFGELSPEVAELLENHLAQDAGARAEAERIRQTLAVTEKTVLRHPELVGFSPSDPIEKPASQQRQGHALSWLAKAAAITLLATLASTAGYFLGKNHDRAAGTQTLAASDVSQRPPRKDSPWARYRVASERGGSGMQVVRLDPTNLNNSMLR